MEAVFNKIKYLIYYETYYKSFLFIKWTKTYM